MKVCMGYLNEKNNHTKDLIKYFEYTREALCVTVRPKMNANDVLDALHPLFMKHGKPEFIRSDNGPEFIATHLQEWLKRIGIKPMQIYPGSPWENGYNERFNGTLRKEVLNAEWFHTTQTSPSRYQCLAQAIQPDQTSPCPKHAPTRPRNIIRETKNQWTNIVG